MTKPSLKPSQLLTVEIIEAIGFGMIEGLQIRDGLPCYEPDPRIIQTIKLDSPRRGEIYTAAEARRIIAVKDPAVVAEIHDWKRRFDGVVREFRSGEHPK